MTIHLQTETTVDRNKFHNNLILRWTTTNPGIFTEIIIQTIIINNLYSLCAYIKCTLT